MLNNENTTPSQRRTFDCYERQIKELQQRKALIKEREQKIFQVKKEVEKKQQEQDKMKTEFEEDPHIQGIKVEETAEFLVPQVEQQTKYVRSPVCPNEKTLLIVNETSIRAAASTPSLDQVSTMSFSDTSTSNTHSNLK